MASNSLKATLPSLQSTKVLREPMCTLITENEHEKKFSMQSVEWSALHTSISLPSAVSPLMYQPSHPWGASDGPAHAVLLWHRKWQTIPFHTVL